MITNAIGMGEGIFYFRHVIIAYTLEALLCCNILVFGEDPIASCALHSQIKS